jgi:flagellar capping protein FliD
MATTSTNMVNALGAGTGVDLKALAQGLVEAEITPRKDQITTKIGKTEAKISGYGAALASLSVIKTAFQGLENPSSILKPVVDINGTTAFSVTAGNTATPGSYNLRVVQLASGQRSLTNTFASSETPLNSGSAFSLQLSVNGGTAKTIRVPTAAASPAGVVSAINASKLGVRATLVNKADGSANPYSILITGETGATKGFTLNSDDGTGSGEVQKVTFGAATTSGNIRIAGVTVALLAGDSASVVASKVKTALDADSYITGFNGRSVVNNQDGSLNLNYAAADGDMSDVSFTDVDVTGVRLSVATTTGFVQGSQVSGLSVTQDAAPKDAIVEFEGTRVNRSSNQITDLVKGLTFDLKQETASSLPVKVTQDTSGVKEKMKALVKSYNDMVSDMGILTGEKNAKDTTDIYSGSLRGDSAASSMRNALRSLFMRSSSTASGNFKSFSDIGVEMTRTGTLELNEAKFDAVIAAHPDQVTTMLTADKENKSYVGDMNRGLIGDTIKQLNQMIGSSGNLNTLTKNANKQISKYKEEMSKLDGRMTLLLARYTKQFSAMESFVGQTTAMRNNLKGQFENLAAMYNNN